jgi:signal transduction histidine kinase
MIKNNMESRPKTPILDQQGRVIFVFVVIVGYIVTMAFNYANNRSVTNDELFMGVLLGVIYLLIGLNDHLIFNFLPAGWADVLFFSVQCGLVLGIGWVLGVGGNGLVGIPLIGFAVERLKTWRRYLVYAALVLAVVSPLGLRFETWMTALINGVTASIIFLFVAMYAHSREKEQQARERAELLMTELEGANKQLAAYATQAEELAMTRERNRLAREIHDNLGHYLTIVNVQIEAARVVMDSEPARALDALKKAKDLTQKGLSRVRESVAALRESPVSNRPLAEAIASLVQEAQSTGIVTEFKVTGETQSLEHKSALAIYRAAQEGLTNVRRHARASRVDVLLDFQRSKVYIEVKDNGVGATKTTGGFGLLGIRERMHLLGGNVEISTGVGEGFCLKASVPLELSDESVRPEV